jgi:23S rRNA pseudouridine2605 synthase
MEERLQKILARAGYGSRRSCEELITAGRVTVNGTRAEIGQKADAAKDQIEVDRSLIPQAKPMLYYAYNKPRFVLCDKVTGDTRRTVFDLVPNGEELSVVGRLDFESEGLVLLTNDGEMVNRLTHPRYEHEKEYRVLLASRPDEKQLDAWRRGIVLEDGHRTSPVDIRIETTLGKGAWMRVVMKEGHKRQIRETAKTLGLFVVRIVRIRIGALVLGNLKSGEWKELSELEVEQLKSGSAGTPRRRHFTSGKKNFSAKKPGGATPRNQPYQQRSKKKPEKKRGK